MKLTEEEFNRMQERRLSERQPELPGVKSLSHSNRGRELEDLLERTHHFYAVRKLAFISKNPVEWRYVNQSHYNTFRDSSADFVAKTNRGLYLKKFKSDVDFSGVIAPTGRMVIFDSKQIKGKSLPLGNIAEHQIRTLSQNESCGAIAGIIILFSDLERVFFVFASVVQKAQFMMLYHRGAKSLSLVLCETDGIEIPVKNNLVDWLAELKNL